MTCLTRHDFLIQRVGCSQVCVDSSGLPREPLTLIADPELKFSLAGLIQNPARSTSQRVATTLAHQPEGRERYTLTRLHAQGGIGQVWVCA
jgi:hypothetical protein